MPEESSELLLPSPFDFAEQAVLYVPSRFPSPSDPTFCEEMAREAYDILKKTEGRALFLFTSYRHMHDVYQRLRDRLPYPLLVQGQKPKRSLLTEFREKIDSVLFATNSFWQGIDVPGEALSCLIIDKLPFDVPDDPLTSARMEHLAQKGGNSFFGYQVPRAVIQLKQGVGRLIRSSNDRGVIAIFDIRLLRKNYGQLFIRSLPPCRLVHKMEEVMRFSFRRENPPVPPARAVRPAMPPGKRLYFERADSWDLRAVRGAGVCRMAEARGATFQKVCGNGPPGGFPFEEISHGHSNGIDHCCAYQWFST